MTSNGKTSAQVQSEVGEVDHTLESIRVAVVRAHDSTGAVSMAQLHRVEIELAKLSKNIETAVTSIVTRETEHCGFQGMARLRSTDDRFVSRIMPNVLNILFVATGRVNAANKLREIKTRVGQTISDADVESAYFIDRLVGEYAAFVQIWNAYNKYDETDASGNRTRYAEALAIKASDLMYNTLPHSLDIPSPAARLEVTLEMRNCFTA